MSENGWISVNERMPDKAKLLLLIKKLKPKGTVIEFGVYSDGKWYDRYINELDSKDILYWIYIPERPENEECKDER